jgi:hypothetical protein
MSAPRRHSPLTVTHFVGSAVLANGAHGFADSPVAKRRHPCGIRAQENDAHPEISPLWNFAIDSAVRRGAGESGNAAKMPGIVEIGHAAKREIKK